MLEIHVSAVGAHVAPGDEAAAGAVRGDYAIALRPPSRRVACEPGVRRMEANRQSARGPSRGHRACGVETLRIELLLTGLPRILPDDQRAPRAVRDDSGRVLARVRLRRHGDPARPV